MLDMVASMNNMKKWMLEESGMEHTLKRTLVVLGRWGAIGKGIRLDGVSGRG